MRQGSQGAHRRLGSRDPARGLQVLGGLERGLGSRGPKKGLGSQGAWSQGWHLRGPGERPWVSGGPRGRAGVSGTHKAIVGLPVGGAGTKPTPLPPQHAKSPKTPFLQTGFSPHCSGVHCAQRSPGPENSPMWVGGRSSVEEVWAGQSPRGPSTSLRRDGPRIVWTELRSLCD